MEAKNTKSFGSPNLAGFRIVNGFDVFLCRSVGRIQLQREAKLGQRPIRIPLLYQDEA